MRMARHVAVATLVRPMKGRHIRKQGVAPFNVGTLIVLATAMSASGRRGFEKSGPPSARLSVLAFNAPFHGSKEWIPGTRALLF